MAAPTPRTILHLQMGQEILYLLMALGLMASLVLILYVRALDAAHSQRASTPEQNSSTLQDQLAGVSKAKDDLIRKTKALSRQIYGLQNQLSDVRAANADLTRDNRALSLSLDNQKRAHSLTYRLNQDLERETKKYAQEIRQLSDQPPLIVLREAQGYTFSSGSASLSEQFRLRLLDTVVPRIIDLAKKYRASIIEVIGHTDEVPVRGVISTIDSSLLRFIHGYTSTEPLISDNLGLGMIRAATIVRVLRADARLDSFTILPLSAGQTHSEDNELATPALNPRAISARRRIEVRLRRSSGR